MITLADVKIHCRIDHSAEDDYLVRLIAASASHLSSIGVDMTADPLPPAVEQAELMLIGHFYEQREATGDGKNAEIEFSVAALVAPFRSFVA